MQLAKFVGTRAHLACISLGLCVRLSFTFPSYFQPRFPPFHFPISLVYVVIALTKNFPLPNIIGIRGITPENF
jgi:hypothetical protein